MALNLSDIPAAHAARWPVRSTSWFVRALEFGRGLAVAVPLCASTSGPGNHEPGTNPDHENEARVLPLSSPRIESLEGGAAEWIVHPRPQLLVRIRISTSAALEITVHVPSGLDVLYSADEFEADSLEIEFVAETSAPWRLSLAPEASGPMSYRIEWVETRQSMPADAERWKAVVSRAAMRAHIGRGEASAAVRAADEAAAARARGEADTLALAQFIENLGLRFVLADADSLRPLGEPFLLRALELRKQAAGGTSLLVANAENTLSTFYFMMGQFEAAAVWERRSLDILESRNDVPDSLLAYSRRELGLIYYHVGRYADAKDLFAAALSIVEAGPAADDYLAADLHNNLGAILRIEKSLDDSRRHFERAAQLFESLLQSVTDPELHATYDRYLRNVWLNAAGLLYDQSRYDEAEVLYRKVTEVPEARDAPQSMLLPTALMNVAIICRIQGRDQESEALFRKALELGRMELGVDHPDTYAYLDHLAELLVEQERFAEAEEVYRDCIGLLERSGAAGISRLGSPLRGLANLMRLQGRHAEAEALYRRGVTNQEQVLGADSPEVARTNVGLARCLVDKDPPELGLASRLVETAFATLQASGTLPEVRVEAKALTAEILYRRGDTRRARDMLAAALEDAESLRRAVSVDDRGRAAFFSAYAHAFDEAVAWSIELDDLPAAVRFVERFRARVLLEQMHLAGVDLKSALPGEVRADLERRENEANLRLAHAERRLELAANSASLDTQSVESLRRERDTSLENLRLVQAEIRRQSPTWNRAAASPSETIDLETIRIEVLEPGEALLLYHVGSARSFAICIPKVGSPRAVELTLAPSDAQALGVEPGPLTSAKLGRAILGGRAVPGGRSRGVAPVGGNATAEDESRSVLEILESPRERLGRAEIGSLHALWNVLVPAAVQRGIRDLEQLAVIPDGVLHRLPYEALVIELRANDETPVFWLEDGPIVRYAPSATVLATLRRMLGERTGSSHGVLTVSDPRFERETASDGDLVVASTAPSQRAMRNGPLAALPGTALESREIVAAFESRDVRVLQGKDAREARVRTELAGKKYIHLAAHGIVENRRDEVYAAIALTPPPGGGVLDRADDGFLELSEVYGLRLDAELVVLSACSTHEGSWIEGDGVFALSRGFLTAGCPRVVGSLWRVDDASTADLIAHFFKTIAAAERAKAQPDFARALRDARLQLRKSPAWNHPYYWAPFVILGLR